MSYGSGNFSGHVCFAQQVAIGEVLLSKETRKRCGGVASSSPSASASAPSGAAEAAPARGGGHFEPFKFAGIEQDFRVLQCAHRHAYVGALGSAPNSNSNAAAAGNGSGSGLPERATYQWAQTSTSPRQRSQTGIVGMAYVRTCVRAPAPLLCRVLRLDSGCFHLIDWLV